MNEKKKKTFSFLKITKFLSFLSYKWLQFSKNAVLTGQKSDFGPQ